MSLFILSGCGGESDGGSGNTKPVLGALINTEVVDVKDNKIDLSLDRTSYHYIDINNKNVNKASFSITNQNSSLGTASITSDGKITYTANNNTGIDRVEVIVTDIKTGERKVLTFNIDITASKSPFTIDPIPNKKVLFNNTLNIKPSATITKKLKKTALNYSADNVDKSLGTVSIKSNQIVYTAKNRSGVDTIHVWGYDSISNTYSKKTSFLVQVYASNAAPSIHVISNKSIFMTDRFSVNIAATSLNTNVFRYAVKNDRNLGVVRISPTGGLAYTAKSKTGRDTVTVTVTDTVNNKKASVRFNVQIKDIPSPVIIPITKQILFTNTTSSPIDIHLDTNKLTGSPLDYSAVNSNNSLGSITINSSNQIIYRAKNNVGTDTVTVTVKDTRYGKTGTHSFNVEIKKSRVVTTNFESSIKVINGTIVSPNHASATRNLGFKYALARSHSIPKTFPINAPTDDYAITIDPDGKIRFTSKMNYLGLVKIPVIVTSPTGAIENIEVTFKTQITGSSFNDPLANRQWHQHNTGQTNGAINGGTAGHDINIGLLHLQGVTGNNIEVAVMDDGLELGHEDLNSNISAGNSYDYVRYDRDPTPTTSADDHGTKVAGILGAVSNNSLGGHGVAPNVLLRGFNYLNNQSIATLTHIYQHKLNNVLIVNKSYVSDRLNYRWRYNVAERVALDATRSYNADRGVLYIKSAGNSFKKKSGYLYRNNRSTPDNLPASNSNSSDGNTFFSHTVVSALSADEANPHASYSSVGSNVFISAPGGEYGWSYPAILAPTFSGYGSFSVDRSQNYVHNMNGTSAAAPVTSGVAALIYGVNNTLTWRDVRHIMAKTAKKIDTASSNVVLTRAGQPDFVAQNGWITNGAGYDFHNWYGFGMVDATKAVQMAANGYTLLPDLQTTGWLSPVIRHDINIPENFNGVQKTIQVVDDITVEAIQIKITIDHSRPSDLAIIVTSPAGTRSVLMTPRSLIGHGVTTERFDKTILLSNAFYGESSQGDWAVEVVDTLNSTFYYDVGTQANNWRLGKFQAIELKAFGH